MEEPELLYKVKHILTQAKYKSFTIWQIITAVQICMVFALIGTIAYKGYLNKKANSNTEGNVAGLATENYTIPNEIDVTIEDITKSFDPVDFGFEFVEIKEGGRKNRILNTLKSYTRQDESSSKVYDKYLKLDETKFSYWLKANFGTLEEEMPLKPKLVFFEKTNQISECVPGYTTKKIPTTTIIEDMKIYKQIPEDLYFTVDVGQLAEDEQRINDTCNQITEFKRNLKKVKIKTGTVVSSDNKNKEVSKTFDFLDENEVNRIFSFHLIKEELVIKVNKKDELRQSIERVKRIFDQKPDTKQVRIDDKLIIVGEEKEIIVINTEESIRVAENLLSRGSQMENFPLIIENNDGIYNSEKVLKFPKKIASSEVKIPTVYQEDAIRTSQILDLYDNIIIEPGTTFSFQNAVSEAKIKALLGNETVSSFTTPDEKVEYHKSIEPISTLYFRLALDSGLPFLERYQNVLNRNIEHFGYPVSEMPLVNITGKGTKINSDGTTKERNIDLKFSNPSDQQMVLLTDYEFQDNNEIILKAELYTTNQFNSFNVQLKDFQKDNFDVNGQYKGYFIVFNRMVNDRQEVYSIYYYDQQTAPPTSN